MRIFPAIGVAALVFAIDQFSKWVVMEVLLLGRRSEFLEVGPFINLVLAYNRGVNFGLFSSSAAWQPFALAAFAGVVSLFLFIWAARTDDWRTSLGCGLAAGGALGNALDRLINGAVVDFINMDCCGIGNPYAFNLADVGVFAGAAFIIWSTWTEGEPDPPPEAASDP
ncbi:MAG: signal peptidase II [Pseudomonadota bacterium]